jgi:hypothetical protein
MRRLLILCVTIAAAACSKNSSGPDSTTKESATTATQGSCTSTLQCPFIESIGFWVRIQSNDGTAGAGGPWSFTFLDKTYTGTGNADFGFVDVAPTNYQLTGQFLASSFSVALVRQAGKGGIVPDSVKSLEGPVSAAASGMCSIGYFIPFGPERGQPHTFKIQFTVARDIQGC